MFYNSWHKYLLRSAPWSCAMLQPFPGYSREGDLRIVIGKDLREQLVGDANTKSEKVQGIVQILFTHCDSTMDWISMD